jgi:hypothetical protein
MLKVTQGLLINEDGKRYYAAKIESLNRSVIVYDYNGLLYTHDEKYSSEVMNFLPDERSSTISKDFLLSCFGNQEASLLLE